ncbi:RDD family protein [Simiduia sp. 21SJ11W-1]|uniref:RDD family protein n=1 Tax=Simiduia sp. 21SJ11W-1 TaxID=2909669 RepID=UPI00209DAF1F|nr:RDD family protein [Simiduia sp. 21SJ11W-1]UTA48256.1 RDD family protein [Simiduia sp. 21SJ11W-1]
MTEEVQQNWIANFWRRIGALFIDTLILGLVGFLLGLALKATFVQIGGWGRLIGFGIALAYFGLMNSKLSNGQTIGKRLLNLRVVDLDNHTIPLIRSVFRYIVLAAPFSLNGAQFSNEALLSYLMYPLSMIVFGGLFSIIYLYIFNRVTRQSLHDLAAGTLVVNANIEKQEVGKVWKLHLVIVAVFFVAAAIVPAFTGKLAQNEPFKDMLAVQSALSNEQEVSYATVTTSTTTFSSVNEGTKTTTYVTAQAVLSSNKVSDVELARKLAAIVIQNYPEAVNKDALRITLTYGYDIGIWSQWSSHTHDFNPGEFAGSE